RRGTQRRRGADPARLARAVDGGTRLRPVLPQRHGRSRRRAGLADLRRPGALVGPRDLAGTARRPPPADKRGGRVRLTVAQALVRFLAAQYSERDGVEQKFFAGCWGIFGHGNVAGIGQALLEVELTEPGSLPYLQARNEQAMVHASAAYARMRNRLATFACTSSI